MAMVASAMSEAVKRAVGDDVAAEAVTGAAATVCEGAGEEECLSHAPRDPAKVSAPGST